MSPLIYCRYPVCQNNHFSVLLLFEYATCNFEIDTLWKILKKILTKRKIHIIPLTPNDHYRDRPAPLTSKRCILYTYSTKIGTEYFKNYIHSLFFSSKCSLFHNSNVFGPCITHILYTGCAKIKKYSSGAKNVVLRSKKSIPFINHNLTVKVYYGKPRHLY